MLPFNIKCGSDVFVSGVCFPSKVIKACQPILKMGN
nr:MAG TPA: hypothetical protein [Caudoviricetes sp.]